jgi:hypothetical protein
MYALQQYVHTRHTMVPAALSLSKARRTAALLLRLQIAAQVKVPSKDVPEMVLDEVAKDTAWAR